MRLRRAQELLADPRTAVTSVALRLGYCSSQHLAACFQQYLGRAPREIRKRKPA
jgi:transcriptional regulator GlxA family with amidase domain